MGKEPAYALTIRARQPESKAGCSEIWVEVAFKNISDRDIEITPRLAYLVSAGHAKSFYASDVRDEKGNSVPETELGRKIGKGDALCIGSAWEALGEQHYAPLRPGESRTNQIHLNKLYDLSKPGKYTVQAHFLDDDAVGAKSNTITITITK